MAKERAAKKTITDGKAALEAGLESLSQALFEEVRSSAMSFILTVHISHRRTKMVATELMKRAETEEELKELRQEKEALSSALRVIEGENFALRSRENAGFPEVEDFASRPRSQTRSSSEMPLSRGQSPLT